jgi:hypothetical protein
MGLIFQKSKQKAAHAFGGARSFYQVAAGLKRPLIICPF